MEETNWPGLIALVSVVNGGVILVCIMQMVSLYRISRKGIRVIGVVDRVIRVSSSEQDGSRGVAYRAKIRYCVNETQYIISPSGNTNAGFYVKGQEVPVYYWPDRPEAGKVVCFREYAKWIVIGFFSAAFLAVLVVIWQMQD